MMNLRKPLTVILLTIFSFLETSVVIAQSTQMTTYCNPLNIDYTYMIYNAYQGISYRSGADPAVVKFRGEYYMFVTRSLGYWHSTDLLKWDFIKPEKWYFQGSNAPAASNYKDSILYVTGDPSGSMSILYTYNPKKGDWKAVPGILNNLQDPDLFIDDDGKPYMYWGSSNKFPIRGEKLDRNQNFKPGDSVYQLFNLNMDAHGWERFGENNSDTVLGGYIEGPWMTKHNSTYYLQYAAPGTEFNVYADGVYTSKNPLGPFVYAPNNPVAFKPGGFINGAGHGSTVIGPQKQYWHFASGAVSVNVNWERRINMFPAGFDNTGNMFVDTYFGDYPHYAPAISGQHGGFRGWMLLSYKKPVKASSYDLDYKPSNINDENIKTFWLAKNNSASQWIEIDLQKPEKINAIQVNFADYKSNMYGRYPHLHHRYKIEGSVDGKNWITLVDQSENFRDVPDDYVELGNARVARYVRYTNIHVPTPHLAISGLRVFGTGNGNAPGPVKGFKVLRQSDRRGAIIHWDKEDGAQGYNVLWGLSPGKLEHSWMVYDKNKLNLKALNADQAYYFSIEAFNENGISTRANAIESN